jgi:hypothetical protein
MWQWGHSAYKPKLPFASMLILHTSVEDQLKHKNSDVQSYPEQLSLSTQAGWVAFSCRAPQLQR